MQSSIPQSSWKTIGLLALMLIYLATPVHSTCGEGCLSCSISGETCQVCNVYDFYFLGDSGKCEHRPVQNCSIPSADGSEVGCYQCEKDHFLDRNTRKCVAIPMNELIDECQSYHWSGVCQQCSDGFFITQMGRCQKVDNPIEKCRVYVDLFTCKECESGYFYDLGSNTCKLITEIKNCLVYSAIECQVCMKGFFLRSNFETSSSLSESVVQTLVNFEYAEISDQNSIFDSRPVNKCIEGKVENCEVHETFDSCKTCKNGYYLNATKKCQSNPLRIITECQVYNEDGSCKRCSLGFYLDQGRCVSAGQVSGCLEFAEDSPECVKCNLATHFKSGEACAPRSESLHITYCMELDPNRDGCHKCLDSFQLTDAGDKCLPFIPHCETYVSSKNSDHPDHTNKNTLNLLCSSCEDHFYTDSTKKNCLPQKVNGCETYVNNQNKCSDCGFGFYKQSNLCYEYTVKNCEEWHKTKNECVSCYKGFYHKDADKSCEPYKKTSCRTFVSNEDKCDECPVGYFKTADADCRPYTVSDCKAYKSNENKCESCHRGYYLDSRHGDSCYPVSLKNCLTNVNEKNQCEECVEGHYKKTVSETIDGVVVTSITCHKYSKANCNEYEENEDKCKNCLAGNYFVSATGECIEYSVANCGNFNPSADKCVDCVSSDFFMDPNFNCQPKNVDNCKTFETNSSNGSCKICNDSFELVDGYCHQKRIPNCKTYELDACKTCKEGFYLKSGSCLPYLAPYCKTYAPDKDECLKCLDYFKRVKADEGCSSNCEYICAPFVIANCVKFDKAEDTEKCLECKKGYYLENTTTCTMNSVVGCIGYNADSNTCNECRPGLVLDTGSNLCNPTTEMQNCSSWTGPIATTCVNCYRGYYLDISDSLCKPVPPIPNCIEYFKNSKLCQYCKQGKKPKSDYTECEDVTKPPNCKIQEFNSNNCSVCEPGYFRTDTGICSMQTLAKCEKYYPNENFCIGCEEGYYANNGQCNKIEYSIQNCLRPNVDLATCMICEDGYYSNSEGKCLVQSVTGCEAISPNTNICQACKDGYFLRAGRCFLPLITQTCLEINEVTEECTVCKGKYFLEDNTCKMRNVVAGGKEIWDPTCFGNSTSDNAACTYCPNYMPSVEIPHFTMSTTTGFFAGCGTVKADYTCEKCLPTFGLRGGTDQTCVVSATPANDICYQQITDSKADASIADADNCEKCKDYSTYWLDTDDNTCKEGNVDNCGKYGEGADEVCDECASGHESVTLNITDSKFTPICIDSGGTLIAGGDVNADCLQYNFGRTDAAPAVSCAVCKKGKITDTDDCDTNITNDYIIQLDHNLVPETKKAQTIQTHWGENNDGLYSIKFGMADSTSEGFFTPDSCKNTNLVYHIYFDPGNGSSDFPAYNFRNSFPLIKYDDHQNTALQKGEFYASNPIFECIDDTNYVEDGVLAYGDTDDGSNDFAILRKGTDPENINFGTGTPCRYFLKNNHGKYRCVSCWGEDKVPVFKYATHVCDRVTAVTPPATGCQEVGSLTSPGRTVPKADWSTVAECKDKTDDVAGSGGAYMSKSYTGMMYSDYGFNNYLSFNAFTQYDNCVTPNGETIDAAFVIFGVQDHSNKVLKMETFRVNSLDQSLIRCIKLNDTQFFSEDLSIDPQYTKTNLKNGIANCQINTYEKITDAYPNLSPGFIDVSVANTFQCLACAPGFKPTFTSNAISSCDAIQNCDVSTPANNTWMNACETPNTGYAWKYDDSTKTILFNELVDASGTAHNCAVFHTEDTKCRLCRDGYALNSNDLCVFTDLDGGCNEKGIPIHSLFGSDADGNNKNKINFDYIMKIASNLTTTDGIGYDCSACKNSNKNLLYINNHTTDSITMCGNSIFNKTPSVNPDAENCATFHSDRSKCIECNADFIVVTGDDSKIEGPCVPTNSGVLNGVTFITDCVAINNTTDKVCLNCSSGNTLYKNSAAYATRACYATSENANCDKIHAEGYCEVCNSGYVVDDANEYKCKAKANSNDETCDQGGFKGECYKCTGANYYPIHYKLLTPNKNIEYQYMCVDQGSDKMASFHGVIVSFDLSTHAMTVEKLGEPSEYHYFTSASALSASGDFLAQNRSKVCIKQDWDTLTPNCERWSQNNFQCSKCKKGYYLNTRTNDHNQCIQDSISNCEEHNNVVDGATVTCKKCSIKYQLNTTATECLEFSIAECKVHDYVNKTCFVCGEDRYIDPLTQVCKLYKNKYRCLLMSHNSDECIKCGPGTILDPVNGICLDHVLANCLTTSTEFYNKCEVCVEGFELFDGVCRLKNQSQNCNGEDENGVCTSCFAGYLLNNGFCIPDLQYKIKGCILYDNPGYFCLKCANGLLLGNGFCFHPNTENCKKYRPGMNFCESCDDGYWNNDGLCVPRENFTCKTFSRLSDECDSCRSGLLLKDGVCSIYKSQNCEVYHPTRDECLSCNKFYFKDSLTKKCLPYTVANCASHDPFRDMCTYCIPEYYRDNRGLCLPRNTDKCLKVDPYANLCVECSSDYYLSDEVIDSNGPSGDDLENDCLPYTVQYCEKYHPRANQCLKCKAGFYKNPDNGNCYRAENFNCNEWNALQTGCRNCLEGFYLTNEVCYPHSVQACSEFDMTRDACLSCKEDHYYNNGECIKRKALNCLSTHASADLCTTCRDQFYFDNGECLKNTSLNCATLSREMNGCLTCLPNYFYNNGNCLPYSVTCENYDPFANACKSCPDSQFLEVKNKLCVDYSMSNCASFHPQSDRCLSCDDLHYWSDGYCKPYTVAHCDVFHTLFDECVTCQEGFYSWGKTCLPYNLKNCAKKSLVADVCLACNEGHFNLEGNCHPYTAEYCATYQPERDACASCLSGAYHRFFVEKDFFKCQVSDQVVNCHTYDPDKNACYECINGYFYDPNSNACHPNPSAVSECSYYTDSKICKECFPPYYLDELTNKCLKSDNIVEKCIVYASNSRCAKCEGANLLSEDKQICQRLYEYSCHTYKDPRNCASCEGNKIINFISDLDNSIVSGLNGEDLSIRRSICVHSGLSNCAVAQENYPNPICKECDKNYFLATPSECKPVTKMVDFCDTYFNDGICAQCEPNYLLSKDKTKCKYDLSFLGENCQQGKFFSEPHCARCKTGYYFDSKGHCQQCEMEGCALCLSDAPKECRLCINGYHMTKELKCEQISLIVSSDGNDSPNNRVISEDSQSSDSSDVLSIWGDLFESHGIFHSLMSIVLLFVLIGLRD